MTRKIDPAERRRQKFNYAVSQAAFAFAGLNKQLSFSVEELGRLIAALNMEPREYNWPETPERSRMHTMYGRRRNK